MKLVLFPLRVSVPPAVEVPVPCDLVIRPLPVIGAEMIVLPVPATVRAKVPRAREGPETVRALPELLVQVWAAPRASGAVMVKRPGDRC